MHSFPAIPFESVNDSMLLTAAGYTCIHYPATWEDIGDAENGPCITGGPAFDEWRNGDHYIIVCEGEIVDADVDPPFDDIPF